MNISRERSMVVIDCVGYVVLCDKSSWNTACNGGDNENYAMVSRAPLVLSL